MIITNTKTHRYWAKKWTDLDYQKIHDINAALDNPTRLSNRVQRAGMSKTTTGYRSAFDILDLGRHSGHRQVGHDVLSAMYTGFTIGGVEGAKAGLLHIMLDNLSDQWRKMMGSAAGRDMIESAMLYNSYDK